MGRIALCLAAKQPGRAPNSDTACRFHVLPPIFHDTRKGWSCCEKRVYDWDEFEQLEGSVGLRAGCFLSRCFVSSSPTFGAGRAMFVPRHARLVAFVGGPHGDLSG